MIFFRVDGECVPKERPRVYRGHAFTPKKTKDYEAKVLSAFNEIYKSYEMPIYEEGTPLVMYLTVHQQIPKSFSKKKTQQALDEIVVPTTHRGDVDNFLKTIADAVCNGYVCKDDCAIYEAHVRKVYSLEPYAEVTIMSRDEHIEMRGKVNANSKFITNLP